MSYVLYYRKPVYHKDCYPWYRTFEIAMEAKNFIEELSDEYDFRVFSEINLAEVFNIAEEEEKKNKNLSNKRTTVRILKYMLKLNKFNKKSERANK